MIPAPLWKQFGIRLSILPPRQTFRAAPISRRSDQTSDPLCGIWQGAELRGSRRGQAGLGSVSGISGISGAAQRISTPHGGEAGGRASIGTTASSGT
jgi:hypothetical protein